jgi:hypothetical protein
MKKKDPYLNKMYYKILSEWIKSDRIILNLSLALLFFISLVYFLWCGDGLFFAQENKSLFFFTGEYLYQFMAKPGGLLEYSGNFLMQGYYSNLFGSLLVSLIIVSFSAVFVKINKRFYTGRRFYILLTLIPACLLLLMHAQYEYYIHYSLGFLSTGFWFLFSISNQIKRLSYVFPALFPVFFYFTGSFAFIYIGMFITFLLVFKRGIPGYFFIALLIMIAFITFVVFREVLFLQPTGSLMFYPLPNDLSNLPTSFYLLSGYMIIFPLSSKISCSFISGSRSFILSPAMSATFVMTITVCLLIKLYDRDHADLMQLEKSVFNKDWDSIIKQHETSPSTNVAGQYYYNLALSERGQLCNRLFFGRQDFGTKSLSLTHFQEQINRSVYFYYTIGLMNEAHHIAYESMVLSGYNPQNIKILIETDLLNGNYRSAERYINMLKKTLHYSAWAAIFEKMLYNPSMIVSHPEMGEKIKLLPRNDFFITQNDIENIDLMLMSNPDNKKAFEYKMAMLLLDKDYKAVVHQVKRMKDMNYTYIPRHIEEAIMVFINGNHELPYLGDFEISRETELRYKLYLAAFRINKNKTRPEFDKLMKKKWGNTFWYYLEFK